ncbi:MAG: circadian clock KaiB family protein [Bacteroidetes bacterium]|nr:circadian clock KaiB family protein [Bacteroidota bacterium]
MKQELIHLRLYVTGLTLRSQSAIANLREICSTEFGEEYQLDIIDVLEHPELAEQEKILATPSLIKTLPPPISRLIGDLSDREKVLFSLEIFDKRTNK